MKTKHLVSTGVILALISSNIIIGNSYINSSKEFESKIKKQSQVIQQHKITNKKQNELIESKTWEISQLRDQRNKLQVNLDKVTIEKDKLKKQLASRGEVKQYRKFYVEATSYIATCSEGCTGITYTEYDVRNTIYYKGMRIIATDNNVIPLYSIVRITTNSQSFEAIVLDRGGGINGYEVDLLAKNTSEARNFGRQKVLITILRNGKG